MANLETVIQERVRKAIKDRELHFSQMLAEKESAIGKLQEHNRCFKDVIKDLEKQLTSTKEDLVKSTFSQSMRNDTTKMNTAHKMQMTSAIQPSRANREEDLFDRDEENEDDIFSGNERFGAIIDDYKRVMNRGKQQKEKESDMLSLAIRPARSRKGTVAPYDGETEMSLRDLEDDSVGTKESPLNDRLTLGDLGKQPDKGTFIETEMSYRGG